MKKLNKKTRNEIIEFVKNNQPKVYWDRLDFDTQAIEKILIDGIDSYMDELFELNLEYISELEHFLVSEVQEMYDEYDPDEIEDLVLEFTIVDMNTKELLSRIPDVACLIYVYSDYDCCNSFDSFEDGGYLPEVYKRVKAGVRKKDFMEEFYNGAYGGCLFAFAFKTDIEDLMELQEKIKTGTEIVIPEGTQFGFFSSFSGAGTVFEKRTYRTMNLKLQGETKYDSIGIVSDITQSYNMQDVYGDTRFIDFQSIEIQ